MRFFALRTVICAVLLSGSLASVALCAEDAADPRETTELWTGAVYTSTFRVGMCISPQGALRGVMLLRLRSGKVDVYHVTGAVKDGRVTATHSSGHVFDGRLVAPDRVEGRITLKSGRKIRIKADRLQGVPLAPDDCAPLSAEGR